LGSEVANPQVVPRESINDTLRRLDAFKADPVSFFAFRNKQFRDYRLLFENANPLRVYL
jgi:hypothetical protein